MYGSSRLMLWGLLACGLAAAEHHRHEHQPPHGGALVVLGGGAAHLELVLDAQHGALTAYVLDGEAERSLRVKQKEIGIRVALAGEKDEPVLVNLKAVANVLTGETEGDSSQFEGSVAALKETARFAGVIVALTVRGREFRDVPFRFPQGNEAEPGKP